MLEPYPADSGYKLKTMRVRCLGVIVPMAENQMKKKREMEWKLGFIGICRAPVKGSSIHT